MSQLDDFKSKFDEEGRFRNRDGTQSVVFAMKGGGRFPGKLQFSNGLCVRAEMEGGGDLGAPGQFTDPRYSFPLGLRRRKVA